MLDVQGDTDAQTRQVKACMHSVRAIEGVPNYKICCLNAAAWLFLDDGSSVDKLTQTQHDFENCA